ncbi:MAG TPA: hypothetical protein DEB10_15305, partial [Ruminococcaceae bacterium]|nr:hypothetical protein [Oscillospiraceae bacterium]
MAEKNLPMREMMVEIEERMRQMNYGEASIYAYWQCWRNLLQYAEGKGEAHFSVKLGEDFLLEKCHVDVYTLNEKPDMPEWKIRAFKRPIYVLAEYQSSGTIVRKNRMHRTEIPERFRAAAEHYAAACYGRYNGERTVSSRLYILKRFLLFLDQINVNTLIEINGVHISEFTKTMIGWAQRTIGSNLATLRHFFRFLYLERYHPKDLSLSVPRVNCGRTVKLPKIWTPNEVEKILTAVDRGTSAGKRDYA